MDTKRCGDCEKFLPATTEFFAVREGGLRAQCRACVRERDRIRRNRPEVRQRIRQAQAKYIIRPDVAEQRRQYQEKYRGDGRLEETRKARKARMTESDRESVRRYARDYHATMTDAQKQHKRRRQAERQRVRRATDPRFRLRNVISTVIGASLRKRGGSKGASWEALVGYSAEELKRHIERQFVRGMSWENYGEWHVDHIVPVAAFEWQSPDDPDFRACWALSNLRPLWAIENKRKSSRRLQLI